MPNMEGYGQRTGGSEEYTPKDSGGVRTKHIPMSQKALDAQRRGGYRGMIKGRKKKPEKKVHMVRLMTQADVDRLTAKNVVIRAKMAEEKLAARVKQGDAIREAYRARKAARPKLGQELGQVAGLLAVGAALGAKTGLFRSNKGGSNGVSNSIERSR